MVVVNGPPMQKYIFDQETAASHTPQIIPFGVTMVGPVLMNMEQKNKRKIFT